MTLKKEKTDKKEEQKTTINFENYENVLNARMWHSYFSWKEAKLLEMTGR